MDERLLKALAHVILKSNLDKGKELVFKIDSAVHKDQEIKTFIDEVFEYYHNH